MQTIRLDHRHLEDGLACVVLEEALSSYTSLDGSLFPKLEIDLSFNRLCSIPSFSSIRLLSNRTDLLHSIVGLDISTNAIREVPAHFRFLRNLTSLSLAYNGISDLSIVAEFKHLARLVLDYNEIADFSPLFHIPELQHLSLRGNKITVIPDMSTCAHLRVLTSFDLSENCLEDIDGLRPLQAAQSLAAFYVDCADPLGCSRRELFVQFSEWFPRFVRTEFQEFRKLLTPIPTRSADAQEPYALSKNSGSNRSAVSASSTFIAHAKVRAPDCDASSISQIREAFADHLAQQEKLYLAKITRWKADFSKLLDAEADRFASFRVSMQMECDRLCQIAGARQGQIQDIVDALPDHLQVRRCDDVDLPSNMFV